MEVETKRQIVKSWEDYQKLQLQSPTKIQNDEVDSQIPLERQARTHRRSRQKNGSTVTTKNF
jgi:hypothetical protein